MQIVKAQVEDAMQTAKIWALASLRVNRPKSDGPLGKWFVQAKLDRTIKAHQRYFEKYPSFVAKVGGKAVGYTIFKLRGNDAFLISLYILPEYQGQGIGQALLDKVLKQTKGRNVYLNILADNPKGLTFYEKNGFNTVRELNAVRRFPDGKFMPRLEMIRIAE